MGKWGKISIVGGVILLFVVLLWIFRTKEEPKKDIIIDDWRQTYDPEDIAPYGTYMLKELMDTIGLFGNFLELDKPLRKALKDNPKINDIYFFIGPTNYMDDSAALFLLDFVDSGNTAFMCCTDFPDKFLDHFKKSFEELFPISPVFDSIQHFMFKHPELAAKRYDYKFVYNNEVTEVEWQYFNPSCFDILPGDTAVFLGSNTQEQINFMKITHGDGTIYLHSTPYLFTNISMMKRSGFQYAEKVLMHIPPGRIQWDKYNLKYNYSSGSGEEGEGGGGEKRESIFQFILNHPPLIWCAVILLTGAFLYAIFKGKRMQRLIPAAELRENTSLSYINTLSSLYQQEGKHNKLIRLKQKTFLNFIAEKYYITTQKPDKKFYEKLSVKSQVPVDVIADLFSSFERLEQVQVSDDSLIALHRKIENFYKKCK